MRGSASKSTHEGKLETAFDILVVNCRILSYFLNLNYSILSYNKKVSILTSIKSNRNYLVSFVSVVFFLIKKRSPYRPKGTVQGKIKIMAYT